MPRDLRDLPGAQLGEDAAGQRLTLGTQPCDFVGDVDLRVVADETQLLDLRLELGDGLFEIEEFEVHAYMISRFGAYSMRTFWLPRSSVSLSLSSRLGRTAHPGPRLSLAEAVSPTYCTETSQFPSR